MFTVILCLLWQTNNIMIILMLFGSSRISQYKDSFTFGVFKWNGGRKLDRVMKKKVLLSWNDLTYCEDASVS